MPIPGVTFPGTRERKILRLPDNSRVIVWLVLNLENWAINAPVARTIITPPQGLTGIVPDIPNYSWYQYGINVGFWRLMSIMDRHKIKPTVSINGSFCEAYPEIVDECLKRDWELLGHGYIQRVLNVEKDERAVIKKTMEAVRKASGKAPKGWLGPGLHETYNTLRLLAEEGFKYVCDWVNNDHPYFIDTGKGRLVSMPYSLEVNDIPINIVNHQGSDGIYKVGRDQFDTLYSEGKLDGKIMGIAFHPYISGQPHRAKHFERLLRYIKSHKRVLFMKGEEIYDWYTSISH